MMKFQIYWGNLQSRFRQRCLEASNLDFLANIQRRPWLTRTLILEHPRAELGSQETRSRTADSLVGAQCIVLGWCHQPFFIWGNNPPYNTCNPFPEAPFTHYRGTYIQNSQLYSPYSSSSFQKEFDHVLVKATIARIIH